MYLFRECLPVPLVYGLGNTIWPQVLSVYLKPSVSVLILIVSRVSSHFASPLIIRAVRNRQYLEWSGRERETRRGTLRDREREKMGINRNKWKKTKTEGMNEWLKESENSYSLKRTASWAFNEWREESWAGDNQTRMSLFQPETRERKTPQIYIS